MLSPAAQKWKEKMMWMDRTIDLRNISLGEAASVARAAMCTLDVDVANHEDKGWVRIFVRECPE